MPKKKRKFGARKSDDAPASRWEIVYSGFVLILLCFFIMLSSFSTMQEAKVMQFVKSFVTAVSILPSGTKFDPGLAVVSGSADMVENRSELAKIFNTLEELEVRSEWYRRIAEKIQSLSASLGKNTVKKYKLDLFLRIARRIDMFSDLCEECRSNKEIISDLAGDIRDIIQFRTRKEVSST